MSSVQQDLQQHKRIEVVDVLRGLVLVLMALDHSRDFFSSVIFDPVDLSQTSAILFFTRWITHFCAPIFIFLVGTGMFLARAQGKTQKELSYFLFTRGLWLIVAEFTLVHIVWTFNFDLRIQDCQIFWAIGWTMIALSIILFLPDILILLIGILLVFPANLLDGREIQLLGQFSFLHTTKDLIFHWPSTIAFYMHYPLIPWIGLPPLGYIFGKVFLLDQQKRTKILFMLGAFCVGLFIVLRFTNFYGEPIHWTSQNTALFTVMSFLNCTKYPPSLLYLLMTLGPTFFLLILLERCNNGLTRILSIYGKVPFFFYLMHIAVIHALAVLFAYGNFGHASPFFSNEILKFDPALLAPYGYGLAMVYAIWIVTLILLFPMCRWYAEVKRRNKQNILFSYL